MTPKDLFKTKSLLVGTRFLAKDKRVLWGFIIACVLAHACFMFKHLYIQTLTIYPKAVAVFFKGGLMEVGVTPVVKKTVPLYLNYVGTTSSVRKVDIRARVKGFLVEQNFKEGDTVKEGDLMLVIDENQYKAAVDEIAAQLERDEAQLEFNNKEVERYKGLADKEYVSREAFDKYVTQAKQAQAAVDASKANLEKANLDLGYCRMYAPLNGRVGRIFVHTGNLVGADQETNLATIVQLDPIYVYFYPSEQQYREIVDFQSKKTLSVDLSFSDGTKYDQKGAVDFIDNTANPQTNTVAMRAVFANPDNKLLPDVYVNLKLLLNEQPDTILVPQKAIMQGQEGSYVYTVEDDGTVKEAIVEVLFSNDGMTAISRGVVEGERVIVDGIQKVRPGIKVRAVNAD